MRACTKQVEYVMAAATLSCSGWVEHIGKGFWGGFNWSHENCGPALYQILDALKINESLEKR